MLIVRSFYRVVFYVVIIMGSVLINTTLWAQPGMDHADLLEAEEYRGELEEIVVIGAQPEWRKPPEEEWRPERFELDESSIGARLQWFPPYTKDERDNYNSVRDRNSETAEFQIFKWDF